MLVLPRGMGVLHDVRMLVLPRGMGVLHGVLGLVVGLDRAAEVVDGLHARGIIASACGGQAALVAPLEILATRRAWPLADLALLLASGGGQEAGLLLSFCIAPSVQGTGALVLLEALLVGAGEFEQ